MSETLPKDLDAARLAYANACERMGMAHANGTRKAWEDAVHEEMTTRRALVAAILSYGRAERERAERAEEALEHAADRIENLLGALKLPLPPHIHLQGLSGNLPSIRDEIRAALASSPSRPDDDKETSRE